MNGMPPMGLGNFVQNAMPNNFDPQQMAMDMLRQAAPNNPFCANLLNLVENNQVDQMVQAVRNYFGQMGIDFDQAFNQFLQQNGYNKGGM